MCEFVLGTTFDFLLLGGPAQIGKIIQGIFTSKLGLILLPISLAEIAACWNLCFIEVGKTPPVGGVQACKAFTGVNKAISIIDNIAGAIQTAPSSVGSYYCDQVDDIKLEELTGGQYLPKEEEKPAEENKPRPTQTPSVQPQTNI